LFDKGKGKEKERPTTPSFRAQKSHSGGKGGRYQQLLSRHKRGRRDSYFSFTEGKREKPPSNHGQKGFLIPHLRKSFTRERGRAVRLIGNAHHLFARTKGSSFRAKRGKDTRQLERRTHQPERGGGLLLQRAGRKKKKEKQNYTDEKSRSAHRRRKKGDGLHLPTGKKKKGRWPAAHILCSDQCRMGGRKGNVFLSLRREKRGGNAHSLFLAKSDPSFRTTREKGEKETNSSSCPEEHLLFVLQPEKEEGRMHLTLFKGRKRSRARAGWAHSLATTAA